MMHGTTPALADMITVCSATEVVCRHTLSAVPQLLSHDVTRGLVRFNSDLATPAHGRISSR